MEQTVNTFHEGLLMDPHPMVQSRESLTDALNATMVTMNGNEVILQNDMGNRKVDNAFLPAGYEPVGMKEYGGIIYIAAYNPITRRGQVGSFPSPDRIKSASAGELTPLSLSFPDIFIDNNILTNNGIKFLKNDSVIYKLSPDNIYLHAGDKFILYGGLINNNLNSDLDFYKNYVSNFFNTTEDDDLLKGNYKILSPKNKLYTFLVGVINSLNTFMDITNKLIKFDHEIKNNKFLSKIINDNISTPEYTLNRGSFIDFSSISLNESNEEDWEQSRKILPWNTYSSKLVSPLYLKINYNHIQSINYKVKGDIIDADCKIYYLQLLKLNNWDVEIYNWDQNLNNWIIDQLTTDVNGKIIIPKNSKVIITLLIPIEDLFLRNESILSVIRFKTSGNLLSVLCNLKVSNNDLLEIDNITYVSHNFTYGEWNDLSQSLFYYLSYPNIYVNVQFEIIGDNSESLSEDSIEDINFYTVLYNNERSIFTNYITECYEYLNKYDLDTYSEYQVSPILVKEFSLSANIIIETTINYNCPDYSNNNELSNSDLYYYSGEEVPNITPIDIYKYYNSFYVIIDDIKTTKSKSKYNSETNLYSCKYTQSFTYNDYYINNNNEIIWNDFYGLLGIQANPNSLLSPIYLPISENLLIKPRYFGTGQIQLNRWRFKLEETENNNITTFTTTLNYGFDQYPKVGLVFDDLKIIFTDISDNSNKIILVDTNSDITDEKVIKIDNLEIGNSVAVTFNSTQYFEKRKVYKITIKYTSHYYNGDVEDLTKKEEITLNLNNIYWYLHTKLFNLIYDRIYNYCDIPELLLSIYDECVKIKCTATYTQEEYIPTLEKNELNERIFITESVYNNYKDKYAYPFSSHLNTYLYTSDFSTFEIEYINESEFPFYVLFEKDISKILTYEKTETNIEDLNNSITPSLNGKISNDCHNFFSKKNYITLNNTDFSFSNNKPRVEYEISYLSKYVSNNWVNNVEIDLYNSFEYFGKCYNKIINTNTNAIKGGYRLYFGPNSGDDKYMGSTRWADGSTLSPDHKYDILEDYPFVAFPNINREFIHPNPIELKNKYNNYTYIILETGSSLVKGTFDYVRGQPTLYYNNCFYNGIRLFVKTSDDNNYVVLVPRLNSSLFLRADIVNYFPFGFIYACLKYTTTKDLNLFHYDANNNLYVHHLTNLILPTLVFKIENEKAINIIDDNYNILNIEKKAYNNSISSSEYIKISTQEIGFTLPSIDNIDLLINYNSNEKWDGVVLLTGETLDSKKSRLNISKFYIGNPLYYYLFSLDLNLHVGKLHEDYEFPVWLENPSYSKVKDSYRYFKIDLSKPWDTSEAIDCFEVDNKNNVHYFDSSDFGNNYKSRKYSTYKSRSVPEPRALILLDYNSGGFKLYDFNDLQ